MPTWRQRAILSNPKIKGLYVITPETANTDELIDKTHQALIGGARLVQYRNKSTDRRLQEKQAKLLLQLCKHSFIPLIINDHLDLALEIDADGLHVGRDDETISEARKRLGSNKILGTSCYNDLERALHAERQGVDYVAFGAFFPSQTKTDTVPVTGDFIRNARNRINIPIVGIGGIEPHNALSAIHSGCDAIAVCHSVYTAKSIKTQTMQFAQLFSVM